MQGDIPHSQGARLAGQQARPGTQHDTQGFAGHSVLFSARRAHNRPAAGCYIYFTLVRISPHTGLKTPYATDHGFLLSLNRGMPWIRSRFFVRKPTKTSVEGFRTKAQEVMP
ncbi:pilus assembly protein FimV [Pseudomonas aeruginosa]|nr:pilus assembly protein FimV [Pseudomonas aeruginosa]MCO2231401.1 pilus assembly protein FimV [Pseudomonas aeruginosa]MCO2240858.1 pilus assembly protein FimV [Pseudomonas aeruginosa]MCO2333605.1 pilus assembly protein FimV [Pseudomonas aeruginosa]MCO2355720.1 pilus assembly protein FimV [Pseudomonas aeruginosa]